VQLLSGEAASLSELIHLLVLLFSEQHAAAGRLAALALKHALS
jgi:hypothetical protein